METPVQKVCCRGCVWESECVCGTVYVLDSVCVLWWVWVWDGEWGCVCVR